MQSICYTLHSENPNVTKILLNKKDFANTLTDQQKTDKLYRKTCQKWKYNLSWDFWEPSGGAFSSLLLK